MNPFEQSHERVLADVRIDTMNVVRELLHDLVDRSTAVAGAENTGRPIRDHLQGLTAGREVTGHIQIMTADRLWLGSVPDCINDLDRKSVV